ncbi:MAG: hypothetical protein HPY85_09450 [Anaerolineae bacterium]|nr:hypothetical protein [Anaerolineae bacterium]
MMLADSERYQRLRERTALVLGYLERLSADSTWAHRASGLRGSLWNALETPVWDKVMEVRLLACLDNGLWMLKQAAMEIPDPEARR